MEGSDAWLLISTALVLFMIPGLALFYGGMVRSKNVLNMLLMNMYCARVDPAAVGGGRLTRWRATATATRPTSATSTSSGLSGSRRQRRCWSPRSS